jgi:hypothetical protein
MLHGIGGGAVSAPRGTFTGLLETEFVQVGEIPVDSALPRLTARTSDVKSFGVGAGVALGIEGDTYIVRSVQNDGTGMTVLVLEGP